MTAGTARATPTTTDRSDFRHVLASGTKVGVAVGAIVIVYLVVSRFVPAGPARALAQALLVLAGAVAASLLPAQWSVARSTEGVAGAAAIGLWGTIVFMAIDVVLLRPLNHFVPTYPWTWDAVGGGSTWWYLPVWWMLGTFVAWMGGLLTAGRAARGGATTLGALARPLVAGAVVITAALQLAPVAIYLPVAIGATFAATLTVLAVVAIARKG
jgi:hypothetical protein